MTDWSRGRMNDDSRLMVGQAAGGTNALGSNWGLAGHDAGSKSFPLFWRGPPAAVVVFASRS